MSCICRYPTQETVTYHGVTSAFGGTMDGSELVLCKYCEGKITSRPTARETLYREGRLSWQHDRKPHTREPLPDIDFTVASAAVLPDDIPTDDDGWTSGQTLASELSGLLPANGSGELEPVSAAR